MAITWPIPQLQPKSVMFARRNLSMSGGLTVTGVEQVVQSSSDYWAATLQVRIHRPTQILAYRALQAQGLGRASEWIIPACGQYGLPGDGSFSSDFSDDFPTPLVGPGASVRSFSAFGSRTLAITMTEHAIIPMAGMYFSIGNRLYTISGVTGGTSYNYNLTFAPKLRSSANFGDAVDFLNPRCLMRLAQDNVGDMDLDLLRFADLTLNFVEVPA